MNTDKKAPKYLNLGCGNRFNKDWINIDIATNAPGVIRHDLSKGIPLPDSSCDVVYHAAVLEHLRPSDAKLFLIECLRVLKPGAILRVGVPDLEKICQLYLDNLSAALKGDKMASLNYDWIMLELFDQIVREKSGGGMADFLRQNPLPNETFVFDRIGEEGRHLVNILRGQNSHVNRSRLAIFIINLIIKLRSLPGVVIREIPQCLLGSKARRALKIGRFRLGGEVHQWMYDRYSLARLLGLSGFSDPQLFDAKTSRIPDWTKFNLDTLPDGQIIKPDLFFMEAVKPLETING